MSRSNSSKHKKKKESKMNSDCGVVVGLGMVLVLVLMSNSTSSAAECRKTAVLFNFGDSNSDTGGGGALSGKPPQYPNGRTYFQKAAGRLCDGRLVIDFLCESVDQSKFLTSYVEPIHRNFSKGVNFALAGATARGSGIYSLGVQVLEFIYFRYESISSSRDEGELGEAEFQNALYTVDIGQNDITGAFKQGHTYDEVVSITIPAIVSSITEAIWRLYQVGGRKFWVHNTGPLGCMPDSIATIKGHLDEYGCISDINDAAQEFNSQLQLACHNLLSRLDYSTIAVVDIYSAKLNLVANASSYGFQFPLLPCKAQNPNQLCPEGSRYISWDGVHYTEAANAIVATSILSTNFTTPPLPFHFFCS